jgi:hypothetical protein
MCASMKTKLRAWSRINGARDGEGGKVPLTPGNDVDLKMAARGRGVGRLGGNDRSGFRTY